jgi:hypothetical protein
MGDGRRIVCIRIEIEISSINILENRAGTGIPSKTSYN